MKKGNIVKYQDPRYLDSPYHIVESCRVKFVEIRGESGILRFVPKKDVKVMNIACLLISESVLRNLIDKAKAGMNMQVISHEVSETWIMVHESKPELVKLYSTRGTSKIFTVEHSAVEYDRLIGYTNRIKITLGRAIKL